MTAIAAPAHGASPGRTGRDRLILLVICCACWIPGMVSRSLWHPDEPRFALMTRTMVATGEYVAPTKMGEIYHSKPVLHLWLTALTSRALGGVSEITMRIPSFFAALGGVLIAHAFASSLFGSGAGLLAGLILASDFRYLTQAQWASTDMLLFLFTAAALAAFYEGRRTKRRGWYLVMYAMCGLATLVKGPVGFVLPGLVVVCHLAARRDAREVLRMRLPLGAVIVTGLVGPWLWLYWRDAGAGHATALLFVESVGRYFNAWNNVHPWHYYLWRFPLDFLPWVPILPGAIVFARRHMPRTHAVYLLCWFAVCFVFYSISPGKRGVYILPVHLPAAVACAWFLDRASSGAWPRARRWIEPARGTIALLFLALGGAAALAGPRVLEAAGVARAGLVGWGVLTAAAGLAIMAVPWRRMVAAVLVAMSAGIAGAALWVVPAVNETSAREALTTAMAEAVPRDAPFAIVTHAEELAYYAGLTPGDELKPGRPMDAWLETPGTIYMLLDDRLMADLADRSGVPFREIARSELRSGRYYLVVRPDAEASR